MRGHNRTWSGAQPGRIVRELVRIGAKNPVLMLDEIDKISGGLRSGGDPESALLEVLDPTQNHRFFDHYMGVPFDLSEVFFVATANVLDRIPSPLRNRLEVIDLAGYSLPEKFEIAKRLVPARVEDHGLTSDMIEFEDEALRALISDHADEMGVRDLDRSVSAICQVGGATAGDGGRPHRGKGHGEGGHAQRGAWHTERPWRRTAQRRAPPGDD